MSDVKIIPSVVRVIENGDKGKFEKDIATLLDQDYMVGGYNFEGDIYSAMMFRPPSIDQDSIPELLEEGSMFDDEGPSC